MTGLAGGAPATALVVITLVGTRWLTRQCRRSLVARRLTSPGAAASLWRGRPWFTPPAKVRQRLEAAGVADPSAVWAVWLASTLLVVLTSLRLAGPGAAALLGCAAAVGAVGWLQAGRRRGAALYESKVPAAMEALARALRSGAALRESIATAAASTPGPLGADLGWVAASAQSGGSVVEALGGWSQRRPLPSVSLASAALCLGAETGGAQARAVDGVAKTLRQRLAVAAEVRALSAQARASGLVIALAPVAFGAVAVGTDAGTAAFLLRNPIGLAMLAAGLALDGAGALWMARLARIGP